MPTNGPTAKCYPTEEQYERWKKNANEAGMSISEYIASMVEAGNKSFSVSVEPDESNAALRRERNELQQELDRARDRIQSLENAVHGSEVGVIEQYIRKNPGAAWNEIVEHVTLTASERVTEHLETLEGTSLRRQDGEYYPIEEGRNGSE